MEIEATEKFDWEELEEWADELEGILVIADEGANIPTEIRRSRSDYSGISEEEKLVSSGRSGKIVQVDFELLRKLIYEHQRYCFARGFSDTQMDILRAIEYASSDRISYSEIEKSNWLQGEPSRSTIYKALNGLIEKDLVERVEQNMYEYVGPGAAKKQSSS